MHVFLNERSFRGQFFERKDFQAALARFLTLVERARRAVEQSGGTLWRSSRMELACALELEDLRTSVNRLGRDFKEQFRDVLYNRANPRPWEPERVHDKTDRFFWIYGPPAQDGELVCDSSMAELAERTNVNGSPLGGLLNLECAIIAGKKELSIEKAGGPTVSLSSFSTSDQIDIWIIECGTPPPYANNDADPPRDEQTCLMDRTRFVRTGRKNQGRELYLHRTRREYWCVDNLHSGGAAHLEIFDRQGRHFREAALDGTLRPASTKDPNKMIAD